LVWNVVRASTQSVTPGEARNYDRYIGTGWREALTQYDSNNHVLNTILVRISTARIHLTELSMRLPSLLFGGLYLWAVYRLARRCFGSGPLFLAVFGLMTLNPLMMDAMSEARGYGMALAAWMWALELILESLESFSAAKFNLAGVLLGLSVAASLAFAAPAVALILVAAAFQKSRLAHLPHLAFLTAFILLAVPLNHAEKAVVTAGASSLRQTLNQLTASSFDTSNRMIAAVARVATGLLAAVGLCAGLMAWRRREQGSASLLAGVVGGSLALSLVLVLSAHRWVHAAFPDGGGIYLVAMMTLLAPAIVARSGRRRLQIAFTVVAAFGVARYAGHVRLPYRAAQNLEGGRDLAKALRTDASGRSVRVAASEEAEGIMRYYRTRYRQGNWKPIELMLPDVTYDYYVVTAGYEPMVKGRGLHVVYHDEGLILAK
jgi:hypothetical protein